MLKRLLRHSRHLATTLVIVSALLAGCTPVPAWTPAPPPTPSPAPATQTAPTATPLPPTATAAPPTATPPRPTVAPTAAPTASVDELAAGLLATLPPKAFELSGKGGVKILPLTAAAGEGPWWAAYSYGMRNFDLKPVPEHFIAVYTRDAGRWQEKARYQFASGDPQSAAPDYVGDGGVKQVQLAPGRSWLQAEGGVGAHGGVFNLLSFDGKALKLEVGHSWVSPGAGNVQDVNGDGVNDVVLNTSDRYIFCYACGVTQVSFVVQAWSQANGKLVEAPLQDMLMGQSGHPGRALSNEAVALARAGLWKDALAQITAARQASVGVKPPFTNESIDWNYGIIKLHTDAMQKLIADNGYPLLTQVFYGDYAAAVDTMRKTPAEQIFRADTPLIKGTVAENWLPQLTGSITTSATAALVVKPNLAPAYFLRGWAVFLANGGQANAAARADIQRAAELAPADALFKQAATLLGGGGPAPTATPSPAPTATPSSSQARRIAFAAGATSSVITARIAGGDIHSYVLRALRGQWAEFNIYSPKNDVVLEIYGVSDGQPLVRSHMRQTGWAGVLPADQDYGVSAVSTGGNADYTLQIIIPERIAFAPGAISATSSGNLTGRQTHDYLLRALAGQTMTVTITSAGNNVLLSIHGMSDGQPLVRVPMGVTTWTGKLPGTQDYAVKAVSVTDGSVSYRMDVTIR